MLSSVAVSFLPFFFFLPQVLLIVVVIINSSCRNPFPSSFPLSPLSRRHCFVFSLSWLCDAMMKSQQVPAPLPWGRLRHVAFKVDRGWHGADSILRNGVCVCVPACLQAPSSSSWSYLKLVWFFWGGFFVFFSSTNEHLWARPDPLFVADGWVDAEEILSQRANPQQTWMLTVTSSPTVCSYSANTFTNPVNLPRRHSCVCFQI